VISVDLLVLDFAGASFVVAFVHVPGLPPVVLDGPIHSFRRLLRETASFRIVDVCANRVAGSLEHKPGIHVVDVGEPEDRVVAAPFRASGLLETAEEANAFTGLSTVTSAVGASELAVRARVPQSHPKTVVSVTVGVARGHRAAVLEVAFQQRFLHDNGVVAVGPVQLDVPV